jgi:short-chain dehydrogenase of various substrate specificities
MKISIITGASSGMGREFARQIDSLKESDEIWIVARREERLNALKEELFAVCRVFPLDLTKAEDIDALISALSLSGGEVNYLVNAAGFGKFGDWSEVDRQDVNGMIDLNDKALVNITAAVIPYMKRGAHIIEMCSISAYLPLENFSVYAASKAFALSYSYALRAELKSKGITVTAICPGWVETEFAACAHNGEGVNGPKALKPMAPADKVVAKAIRAANANRAVSIYGLTWKCMHVFSKLLPKRLVMFLWHCMQKRK